MRRFLSRLLVHLAAELNPGGSVVWSDRRVVLPFDIAVEVGGAIFCGVDFDSSVSFAGKNSPMLGLTFGTVTFGPEELR